MIQKIDYKTHKKPTDRIKFEAGDNTIRIISDGFLVTKHQFRTGGRFVSVDCPGVGCKQCQAGAEPKILYVWIVLDRTNTRAGIIEVSGGLGEQICEIGKHKDLKEIDINVNRVGTTKEDTRYTVTEATNTIELSDKEKEIANANFVRLKNKYFKS